HFFVVQALPSHTRTLKGRVFGASGKPHSILMRVDVEFDRLLLVPEAKGPPDSVRLHWVTDGNPVDGEFQLAFQLLAVGHGSRRYRSLIQPATMPLPAIRADICANAVRGGARVWRASSKPGMRAVAVVVALEIEELPLQINGRPEQGAIQTFAPDGADQPFNKRMRERHIRDGLDCLHVEDSQIPLPLAEAIQRVMIRADVGWWALTARRAIEHAT